MSILESVQEVRGQALPFSTYEDDPPRAVERGMDLVREACAAHGVEPSKLIVELERLALTVACAEQGQVVEERALVEYSTFARFAASLDQLRSNADFSPVIKSALAINGAGNFAHDECLLFLSSKLLARGLPVVPVPGARRHRVSNPDLVSPEASHRRAEMFIELKEREPNAARTMSTLMRYIPRKIEECSKQIRARDDEARGFAFVDLGRVYERDVPAILQLLRPVLNGHKNLYGALISRTLCQRAPTSRGDVFVPVFRSHMIDVKERVYEGRYRLSLSTIEALQRTFEVARSGSR